MHREDFEIYEKKVEGEVVYCFDVEYFGHYEALTMDAIHSKVEKIKIKVQEKLEKIEQENKDYYAKLAKQDEELKLLLKKNRQWRSEEPAPAPKSKEEKFINQVLSLVNQGYSKTEIIKALRKEI